MCGGPRGCADVGIIVEAERLKARLLSAGVRSAAQDSGVGWPVWVVGARKEQSLARVIEQGKMVGQKDGEPVDDRHLARLAGLGGDELLRAPVPAAVDVNPAAIEIDCANGERKQLAEPQTSVDREPKRGPILRSHRGDQLCRFCGRRDAVAGCWPRRSRTSGSPNRSRTKGSSRRSRASERFARAEAT